jgi:hypothetical protein
MGVVYLLILEPSYLNCSAPPNNLAWVWDCGFASTLSLDMEAQFITGMPLEAELHLYLSCLQHLKRKPHKEVPKALSSFSFA